MRYLVRSRRGHKLAQDLWAGADQVVTASITYVETRAALAAGRRGRHWTAPEQGRLQQAWETAWREVFVIDVDPLIRLAADLAEREGLRGFDAVQLAAARAGECDLVVAADRRLCEAARRQRLEVLDLDPAE
jgi:predicted nucleic acid-binding protein